MAKLSSRTVTSTHGNGRLRRAEIVMLDEEPVVLSFDETGSQAASDVASGGR